MTISAVEYLDAGGRSPFGKWFEALAPANAAKVATAIVRLEQGNFSNAKSLSGGLFEYRMTFGPGYRVYFGKDGDTLIILLAGGTKRRQSRDIETARNRWRDYKRRAKEI